MITGNKSIFLNFSQAIMMIFAMQNAIIAAIPVDTIKIPEITIYDTYLNNKINLPANRDTADISTLHYRDIGQMLHNRSPLHIRTYGPGLTYSLSSRGSNSAQVAVLWNDILINHPLPGMADLSLLKMGGTGSIRFNPIGNQSGIAGTLEMNDHFVPEQGFLSLSCVLHSTIGYELKANAGFNNTNHSLQTFISADQNRNAYRFLKDNESVRQVHATTRFEQFKTSYQYQINRMAQVGTHIWLLGSHREIPPSLYENFSDAIQKDQAARFIVYYHLKFKKSVFKLQTAFLHDLLQYESQNKSISTRSVGNKMVQQIIFSHILSGHASLNAKLEDEYVFAGSTAYPNPPTYHQTLLRTDLNTRLGKRSDLTAGFKTGLRDRKFVPFSPFFQSSLRLGKNTGLMVSAGRNFRFPGFNDYYWPVGGNPDLKPETSTEADIGIEAKILNHFNLGTHIYLKNISDWIIWLPKQGLFYAQNMESVRSLGMESRIGYTIETKSAGLATELMYHFNRTYSLISNPEKFQMIYTPIHTIKHIVMLRYGNNALTAFQTWTSPVYTSTDNTYSIKPYYLLDIFFDRSFALWNRESKWFISLNNILNVNYQTIENFPMPGFNFSLGFKTDLNHRST